MTDPSGHAARDAFLRQTDRLAAAVLELAGAAPEAADRAVAETVAAWVTGATPSDPVAWPETFWSQVLRSPGLVPGRSFAPTGPLAALASMPVLVRMAVLLRLAGLDEAAAARVMGQPLEGFRGLLAQGLPRDAQGGLDGAAWQGWAQALRVRVASGSTERTLRLAAARSGQPLTAAAPVMADDAAQAEASETPRRRRWHWIAGIAVMTAAALLSTWVVERVRYTSDGTPRIRTRALAATPAPAQRTPASASRGEIALVGEDAATAADLAFLAWYAHRRETVSANVLTPLPDVPEAPPSSETSETTDAL